MRDIDPRDYEPREHEDRRPQLSRGSGAADGARGPHRPTGDPLDVAVRHVDLPDGPRREPLRIRGRDYNINGRQSRVLATVGAFRVVSSRDLETSFGRIDDPRSADLRHLRESRLIEMMRRPGHRDRIVTLTEDGRCREEDVEVTTIHYRGAHAAATARSGFARYGAMSVYRVHHRALYGAIGEPQSRFRRPVPAAAVTSRLMLLDAVLERHPR